METCRKGEMRKKRKVSYICLLLLALLQFTTPSTAQGSVTTATTRTTTTTSTPPQRPAASRYSTQPANVTVAAGDPAEFRCGVPATSPNLLFTFIGSHSNNLSCPGGSVEDIPQALVGRCEMKEGESLAVWTLKGTSLPDNGTRVICQASNSSDVLTAVLHVYDSGLSQATLIGCTIGGFFGMVLVAGFAFILLQRSSALQKCYRGKEIEDDAATIVTKD